jgi:hypothetical protein
MSRYYVNKNAQDNGDHEVHKDGCSYMPEPENRKYLGEFSNCHDAVREAKRHYQMTSSNVCEFYPTGSLIRTAVKRRYVSSVSYWRHQSPRRCLQHI